MFGELHGYGVSRHPHLHDGPGAIVGVLARADGRWVLAAAAMWLLVQLLHV